MRSGRGGPPFLWLVIVLGVVALVLALIRLPGDSGPQAAGRAGGDLPNGPPSAPAVPPPPCSRGDLLAPFSEYGQWDRTLLDTTYGLLPSYGPPDLVPVTRAGFRSARGLAVRAFAVKDLGALRRAAALAGHPVDIEAAYRSYAQQVSLLHRRADQLGRAEALSRTARPGHSEHQLGTTLDFKTAGTEDVTQDWGSTPTGDWMAEHGWRYGFVLSYPPAAVALTCYTYEPWHFRYFGRATAARIHASGLTEREYLWNQERPAP